MADDWTLRFICCGRDDGAKSFATWDEADAFRESYTTGPGVGPDGHDRAAVLTAQGAHEGCPYRAVLIEHEDGPWYFCNKCGWGEEVPPVSEATDG